MLKRLIHSSPPTGIQHQALVQQLGETCHKTGVVRTGLGGAESGGKVTTRLHGHLHQSHHSLARGCISVELAEAQVGFKVGLATQELILSQMAFDLLVGEPALDSHHKLEHLIVATARKKDMPSKQFVAGHANGPEIDLLVIILTQNDLRGPVKARLEIRRGRVVQVSREEGGAEVANLNLNDTYKAYTHTSKSYV